MAKTDTWMPLYIGDYLADTARLNTLGHGAYMLLIMDYWVSGAPIDNDEELASITRLSIQEWKKLRPKLERFFEIRDGQWHHKRIEEEKSNAEIVAQERSKAGSKGAAKRWQTDSRAISLPLTSGWQNDAPSPSPLPTSKENQKHCQAKAPDAVSLESENPEKPKPKNGKHATAIYLVDAQDVFEYLNHATDSQFQLKNPKGELTANGELVIARLREGYTRLQLNEVVLARCKAWGNDPKMQEYLRPATLFAKSNFEKYLGAL